MIEYSLLTKIIDLREEVKQAESVRNCIENYCKKTED